MRERIALVGGTFSIETTPGHGTTLFIQIPFSIEPTTETDNA
jgi:signal transduction histidine kinase